MGAVLFYHPQPQHNVMREHVNRYGLTTSVGVLLEDTLIVATLIFGGILEKYPDLKVWRCPWRWLRLLWHGATGSRLAGTL